MKTEVLNELLNCCEKEYLQADCPVEKGISEHDIGQIVYLLRHLLFPEYMGINLQLDKERLKRYIERFWNKITVAVESLGNQDENYKEYIADTVVKSIPELRTKIMKDIQATYEGDPEAHSYKEIVLAYPGLLATMIYRLAHILWELNVSILPRILTEYAHSKTGIDIHPGANIGEYFFIDHGTGAVIGETTDIGNHVKIYQGVTLGAISTSGGQKLKEVKRHPTLEDNVTIYAGASILGGKTIIGKGTVVGSNAFITKSVECKTKICIMK